MLLIIDPGKIHLGYLLPQESTKRLPPIPQSILQQPIRGRDPSHELVMLSIHVSRPVLHLLLGIRSEPPPTPPAVRVPHRADDPRIPIPQEIQKRAPRRFHHRFVEARVPRFNFPLDEDDLRFRVGCDELFGESDGRGVSGDGAEGAEEGVPFGFGEGGSFGEEFGVLGCVPRGAVADVGEPEDGMVASVAEDIERDLQSCGIRVCLAVGF